MVLLPQPGILLVKMLLCLWLHSMSIGRGFGILAILAGIDRDNLAMLSGAALSGDVQRAIALDIAVSEAAEGEHFSLT